LGPTHESISNDFAFHPATDITGEVHDAVRISFGSLAHWVLDHVPPGAARSTAIARLREAMMWSNAAVACDSNSAALAPENPKL
jgi:hypothetical protein